MLLTLPLAARAAREVRVDLFLATECPISNRYVPELNRLVAEFSGRGVKFSGWFPEPELKPARLEKWRNDFKPQFAIHVDANAREASRLGVTVTPEAAVSFEGKLVYRGRIDDRYLGWGKSRAVPTRRDVAMVVEQILRGERPPFQSTKAWGCVIEGVVKR
jgi:hypothetical protein